MLWKTSWELLKMVWIHRGCVVVIRRVGLVTRKNEELSLLDLKGKRCSDRESFYVQRPCLV